MKKCILAVLVVILAIFGGIMTVMSLVLVGQGEVGVVWTMKDGMLTGMWMPRQMAAW